MRLSENIIQWLLSIVVGIAMTGGVFFFAGHTFDDTDDAINGIRSDMELRTDYGTGCQYLVAQYGMTPRLNGDGKPMCGK